MSRRKKKITRVGLWLWKKILPFATVYIEAEIARRTRREVHEVMERKGY